MRARPPVPTLDTLAVALTIILCAVATVWLRDLATPRPTTLIRPPTVADGGRQPNVRPPRPVAPLPTEPISIEGATVKGRADARVVLLEYSDFECPYCARFAVDTWPEIDRKYVAPGKVRLAFRHLPIESIHPRAAQAAEAAECAGRQDRFWTLHDALFRQPKQFDRETLVAHARTGGLDVAAFGRCLAGETTAKVRADVATADALGITGTPTFMIGVVQPDGRVKIVQRLAGARPLSAFETALDAVLNLAAARP